MSFENNTLCKFKTKVLYNYHFVGTGTTFTYNTQLEIFCVFHGTTLYSSAYVPMTKEQFDEACREVLYNSLKRNVYSN